MKRALDYACEGLWEMGAAGQFDRLQQVKQVVTSDAIVTKHSSNSPVPVSNQIYNLFIVHIYIKALAVLGHPYYCLGLPSKNSFMKHQMCNPNWLALQLTDQDKLPCRSYGMGMAVKVGADAEVSQHIGLKTNNDAD
ncbi:MAG: hypothetical protein ACREX1_19220 [Advenella sp.]